MLKTYITKYKIELVLYSISLVFLVILANVHILENPMESIPYNRGDWMLDELSCPDTRITVLLQRSLSKVETAPDDPCYVISGKWIDAYTGQMVFSKKVSVDHIIPLKWAHQHGGAQWPVAKKRAFASDPENLAVTHRTNNLRKTSQGPDRWLPANPDLHCDYLTKWQSLLLNYGLQLNAAEQAVITQGLASCD